MDPTIRFRHALSRRLLHVLGAAAVVAPASYAAGCGGKVVDEQGGYGGAGGGGAQTSTTATTSTDVASSTADVGKSVTVTTATTTATSVTSSTGTTNPTETKCVPWAADAPCPSGVEGLALLNQYDCQDPDYEWTTSIVSGPWQDEDGQCCYEVTVDYCGVGRPFRREGAVVLAREDRRVGWSDPVPLPSTEGMSPEHRARLALSWSRDARMEHASIAAFARFSMDLLAAGAPSDLVEQAHAAALDEIRHARLCFALASAFQREAIGPGPLALGDSVGLSGDLVALARSTAEEGCIGETLAALLAAEELARETDPAVARVLQTIAEDESRHAELAFRTVAWAIREGGEPVRNAVREVLEAALQGRLTAAVTASRLDEKTVRDAIARGLEDVIAPAAATLLSREGANSGATTLQLS